MKKILISLLSVLLLTGCNYQVIDYNLKFKKVHLYESNCCYEITSWRDYENGEQIQVSIKEKGTVLLSANSCFLVEDRCPICD